MQFLDLVPVLSGCVLDRDRVFYDDPELSKFVSVKMPIANFVNRIPEVPHSSAFAVPGGASCAYLYKLDACEFIGLVSCADSHGHPRYPMAAYNDSG